MTTRDQYDCWCMRIFSDLQGGAGPLGSLWPLMAEFSTALGTAGRWFESSCPDQLMRPTCGDHSGGSEFEILFGISHDFAVGGVIGSLDRNDAVADLRILFANELCEVRLGAGRTDDEDFAGVADGVHGLRQKFLVKADMAAADRIGFVVEVPCRHVRMQHKLVGARQTDVKNLGLGMIDPDDRVEMVRHALFSSPAIRRPDL